MKKLRFIGIGGATNILFGGNCCYLKDGENLLIIDACESVTAELKKRNVFDGVKNIYIVITHTHYDHVAGLGILIWYSKFNLKIKPNIVYSSSKYVRHIKKLLKVTGVKKKHVEFMKDSSFDLNGLSMEIQSTTHVPELQCFGIMFSDKDGKYYYTGDTNDIDYVKELSSDDNVKRIYTEVASESFGTHIKYDDIIDLDKDKLVLMHFNNEEIYKKAKKEGFEVAVVEKE